MTQKKSDIEKFAGRLDKFCAKEGLDAETMWDKFSELFVWQASKVDDPEQAACLLANADVCLHMGLNVYASYK